MTGPKYRNVDDTSRYNPTSHQVTSEKLMTGPVYPGIESHNSYNPKEERVHGEVPMAGPKYPGVEAHNLYSPMNENPPIYDQQMSGPVYPGIQASNKYNPKSEVSSIADPERWRESTRKTGIVRFRIGNRVIRFCPGRSITESRLPTVTFRPETKRTERFFRRLLRDQVWLG
jgi:hypothetical protein